MGLTRHQIPPPIQGWMQQHASRIAEVFRETESLTTGLYAPQWQSYLNAGRYEPQAMMPIYYCLVFALWARRYADHINPTAEAMQTAVNRGLPPFSYSDLTSPCHKAFREQSPAHLATARWFCQMLGNVPDGGNAKLIGDTDGFYTTLTQRSGYEEVSNVDIADTVILIDAVSVSEYAKRPYGKPQTVLAFIPFDTSEQQQAQEALQALNTRCPVLGHQAVPVGDDRAVLIARCAPALPAT